MESMEKDFDYYAFISYNREDEKWAKWLQNKLENYKLPAIILKENADLPQKIRPVFRDKTDMEAGAIVDTVQKKLERSQYLIVICSPKAAKSNWVGSEIRAFVEMGRSDRIIPFIVDGVPNSNDSRECFHPHIKEKIPEPLGVNINEIGKQQAFVKTAAKLLNLRFDVLWDRFRIAQKKQRLISAATGLLCLAALCWVLNYFSTKNEYYADYTDRWGIPEGIVKLNEAQVKKRNTHYRFEKSQGKLRRVVYANSAGTPIEHENIEYSDRPSIQEFKYEDGELYKTIIKNAKNKTIAAYFWGGYNVIDIKDEKGISGAILNDNNYTAMSSDAFTFRRSNAVIKRFKLERNDEGYITRREFMRNNGDDDEKARNIDGILGIDYEYNYVLDKYCRPVKIRYLGSSDAVGVTGKEYEYDGYGNIYKVTYFGEDDEHILNKLGWSTAVYEFDPNGNISSEYYLDNNGKPCLNIYNYAKITYIYDELGNIKEKTFFNIADNSYNLIYKGVYKYNKHGNITDETYFGFDFKLCLDDYGINYTKVEYKYDKRGNMTEAAYFDPNYDEPDNQNIVRIIYIFDERGKITEEAHFDPDGNPVGFGYAKVKYKYDDQGNIIEEAFFDNNGEPYWMGGDGYGYTKVTYKYKRGNMTEEAYFGLNGELSPPYYLRNYAVTKYDFNDQGNLTEIAYFDADGKACLAQVRGNSIDNPYEISYAKIKFLHDNHGNIKEETYFDIDDDPRVIETGYAKVRYKYDKLRNMTEEAYFDINDKLCMDEYRGYAKVEYKYDERGNMTEEAYFDKDGKPCLMEGRYAKATYKYDKLRNLREEAYFDTDGKLRLVDTGFSWGFKYARVEYYYNELRERIYAEYFDTNNVIIK
jgi:hypothetical protein